MYTIARIEIAELAQQFSAQMPSQARFLYVVPLPPPAKSAIFALVNTNNVITTYNFLCINSNVPFMLPLDISIDCLEPLGHVLVPKMTGPLKLPGGQAQRMSIIDFHVFVVHDNPVISSKDIDDTINNIFKKDGR